MAERRGPRLRPTGMWMRVLGTLVALPLVLAGCGDSGADSDASKGRVAPPACPSTTPSGTHVGSADLDGDGTPEQIDFVPATGTCGALLSAVVGGHDGSVALDDVTPMKPARSFAISIPGRHGEVAVLRQEHPRGGFQVILLAWTAGGGLSTLNVDDGPVFPFVATDTLTDPIAATCTAGGFELTRARAHEPVGVVPAWDVDRTTYTVDGNTVTKGPTTEIADNVLDKQLHRDYRQLTQYSLFANCRTGG